MILSKDNLKSVQAKSLEMLVEVDEFLKKNNIDYMLSFGTALGAVRHGGFIPWDDDVDIDMSIRDMMRLAKVCKKDKVFSEKYFLQNKWTDPNVPEQFWRIRMNGTTMMDKEGLAVKMHWGLPIDIFPIYNAPKNHFFRKIMTFCNRKMREYSVYSFLHSNAPVFKKGKKIALYKCFHYLLVFFDLIFQRSKYVFYSVGYSDNSRFIEKNVFFPTTTILFEGKEFMCHNQERKYLESQYGDYMKLPPEEERVGHGCYKVDMNKDYLEYINNSK